MILIIFAGLACKKYFLIGFDTARQAILNFLVAHLPEPASAKSYLGFFKGIFGDEEMKKERLSPPRKHDKRFWKAH